MTNPVLHFVPRAELEPHENLHAFVELCRKSAVLDAAEQWDSNVWKVGFLKAKNTQLRAVFNTDEASQASAALPALPDPFLGFAKATLVYLEDQRPIVSPTTSRLPALRCLEVALREWSKGSRPTAVNVEVLDSAVDHAYRRFSADVAFRVAGQLQLIAKMMNTNRFITLRRRWEHGRKKPDSLGSRISPEAMQARQEKLPSAAVLRALGNIFRAAVKPFDVFASSYPALMLCAPERANEVLRLTRACVVKGDGRFTGRIGLRWPGSKGAENTTKWFPTKMKDVGPQAVANLLAVTAPAHAIATWYTNNPKKMYVHEAATHLRGQEVLSPSEIGLLLWGDAGARNQANLWAGETHGLSSVPIDGRRIGYLWKDVEAAVLSMLPPTFPFVPGAPELLCKDALSILRANESHADRATYLCMFTCADYQTFANQLGVRTAQSIFVRFEYTEDDGSPIQVTSHAFRHYLNMLAIMGGMSDTEIAAFSGRKDVGQNPAYNGSTSEAIQAPINEAIANGFTSELIEPSSRRLVARSEFGGLGLVAAHTTDYGWCMHSFASEPCQMYRDCINCEEQECIKGEAHKESNLKLLQKETNYLLKQAAEALSEREYGADNWVIHQTNTLKRVDELLAIMADPSVPDGSRIRLDITNAPLITRDDWQPIDIVRRINSPSGTKA